MPRQQSTIVEHDLNVVHATQRSRSRSPPVPNHPRGLTLLVLLRLDDGRRGRNNSASLQLLGVPRSARSWLVILIVVGIVKVFINMLEQCMGPGIRGL